MPVNNRLMRGHESGGDNMPARGFAGIGQMPAFAQAMGMPNTCRCRVADKVLSLAATVAIGQHCEIRADKRAIGSVINIVPV